MTLRLRIGEQLQVARSGLDDATWTALCSWALAQWTLDNPAYWEARRHRRPCKHLPRQFALATADADGLVLPRGAGLALKRWLRSHAAAVAVEVDDRRVAPAAAPMTLQVALRDYQLDAVERASSHRDGVVVAPTGSGKTVIAMGLIASLGVRALVLVHTRTLVAQVEDAVRRCLAIEAGVVAAGTCRIADVTVATVQSLSRRDLSELRDAFGLVILDEAHHCPAATFAHVVQQFRARWRIGLTATPERADRLDPLMHAALGPELVRLQPRDLQAVGSLATAEVTPVHTDFAGGRLVDHNRMITKLIADEARNHHVVQTVVQTRGRRSLVLSERVDHCLTLAAQLAANGVAAEALVGRLDDERRRQALARFRDGDGGVLVATTALVGEGFDCPELDTLYLTVPSANIARVTQALGRVLRPQPGKAMARVFDFVDVATPGLARKLAQRLKVYRTHNVHCGPPLPSALPAAPR